jgi:hypothetical protein
MNRHLALIPALALLTGCPSFSTMGTARTLPKGKSQFFLAPGGMVLRDFQRNSSGTFDSFGLPTVEFGGRFGVTDDAEVGGKLWLTGAEIDTKFALARAESPEAGLDLALAPAVSVYPFTVGDTSATYAWVHLPLLIGFNTGGGSQLVLGPRMSGMIIGGAGERITAIWLGGSVGWAIKLGDGFRLLPEVSIAYPATVWSGGSSTTSLDPKGAMIQGSLGFLFGGE